MGHELDNCDLASTPKPRGFKALGSLLVEDGGDAYCKDQYDIDEQLEIVKNTDPTLQNIEFSVGDFPTAHSPHQFNGRRKIHADGSMSRVENIQEYAVGRSQRRQTKNIDDFHDHPQRDEMV